MRAAEKQDANFHSGDLGAKRSMDSQFDFVAIDFETANESRSSACAIGVTTVHNGEIVDSFAHLIKPPELRFSVWNSNVHGLTEDHVKDSPTLGELWCEILPFVENQLIVAHNASFDISVLRHSLHAASIPIPRLSYACSLQIARSVWPERICHKLEFLADQLCIPLDHHEAGSDSRACAEIVLKSLQLKQVSSVTFLTEALKIRLGEVYSADDWIPASAPHLCKNIQAFEIEIPDGYDISTHEFFGRNVAFTGELKMFRRKDAFRITEQFGGFPGESVTKKTSYLIAGNQDVRMLACGMVESSKLQKAKKLRDSGFDIKIISESDFIEMIFSPSKTGLNDE